MITQITIENLPSYELGMERGLEQGIERGVKRGLEQGMETIIRQLLLTQSAEQVAHLIQFPLDKIKRIKNNTAH